MSIIYTVTSPMTRKTTTHKTLRAAARRLRYVRALYGVGYVSAPDGRECDIVDASRRASLTPSWGW